MQTEKIDLKTQTGPWLQNLILDNGEFISLVLLEDGVKKQKLVLLLDKLGEFEAAEAVVTEAGDLVEQIQNLCQSLNSEFENHDFMLGEGFVEMVKNKALNGVKKYQEKCAATICPQILKFTIGGTGPQRGYYVLLQANLAYTGLSLPELNEQHEIEIKSEAEYSFNSRNRAYQILVKKFGDRVDSTDLSASGRRLIINQLLKFYRAVYRDHPALDKLLNPDPCWQEKYFRYYVNNFEMDSTRLSESESLGRLIDFIKTSLRNSIFEFYIYGVFDGFDLVNPSLKEFAENPAWLETKVQLFNALLADVYDFVVKQNTTVADDLKDDFYDHLSDLRKGPIDNEQKDKLNKILAKTWARHPFESSVIEEQDQNTIGFLQAAHSPISLKEWQEYSQSEEEYLNQLIVKYKLPIIGKKYRKIIPLDYDNPNADTVRNSIVTKALEKWTKASNNPKE